MEIFDKHYYEISYLTKRKLAVVLEDGPDDEANQHSQSWVLFYFGAYKVDSHLSSYYNSQFYLPTQRVLHLSCT